MEPSGLVGRTVGGWVVIALGVAPLAAAAARGRMDGAAPPEPPRTWVDTTMVPPSGATVLVRAGADLQAAIGLHQLARIEDMWRRRDAIWRVYDEELADLPLTRPAPVARTAS